MDTDNYTKGELQDALANYKRLQRREHAHRLEAERIVKCLRLLIDPKEQTHSLASLVGVFREALEAETASLLLPTGNGSYQSLATTEALLLDAIWPALDLFDRALSAGTIAVFDTSEVREWQDLPFALDPPHRSALVCPFSTHSSQGILIATHQEAAFFHNGHCQQWNRFQPIATQAILSREQHEREKQMYMKSQNMNQELREKSVDLEAALIREQKLTRLKDEFLSSMSHEFRTPLNAILGLSEVMQEEIYGAVSEKQKTALKTIEESGRKLLDLITDLMDVTRLGAQLVTLDIQDLQMKTIVQKAIRSESQAARIKDICVHHDESVDLPMVQADGRRVLRSIIHLLQNAIKFSPKGSSVHVSYSLDVPNHLSIVVADHGIGIKESFLASAFEPMVQQDGSLHRQYSGTGLGLSLVSRIMERHHGSVDVVSHEGVGSTFTLHLPFRQPELTSDETMP